MFDIVLDIRTQDSSREKLFSDAKGVREVRRSRAFVPISWLYERYSQVSFDVCMGLWKTEIVRHMA